MKRKLLMVVLAFAFVLSIGLMVACADKGDDPVTGGDITLTVENVPKTGMVGREVKLPAASASDSKEGDLTDRVKLNVDLLKADGTTSKQILFRVAANKEQKFTPSGNELLDYKITYFVSNDAGDTKEVKFDFKAAADTEAPVLSLDKSGDFANFDPATGVTGVRATQDIRLPRGGRQGDRGRLRRVFAHRNARISRERRRVCRAHSELHGRRETDVPPHRGKL